MKDRQHTKSRNVCYVNYKYILQNNYFIPRHCVNVTLWIWIRYKTGLKLGLPGWFSFGGKVWGDSKTFLGFTIFSSNINHASKNSPVPSIFLKYKYHHRDFIKKQIFISQLINNDFNKSLAWWKKFTKQLLVMNSC